MSKEYYILSSERNFPLLREKIIPKYQKQEAVHNTSEKDEIEKNGL